MRKLYPILLLSLILALLSGCKEQAKPAEKQEQENTIAVDFEFSNEPFTEGEAVCMRVVFRNHTRDTLSMSEYPLKNLELVAVDGPPVQRVQRAPHITPPKMWLAPGDSSTDVISLTGFYENSGPGMLAPGTYMVKTHTFFRTGEYIRTRMREYGYRDSTTFTVVPPEGEAKTAFDEYLKIMNSARGVQSFAGNKNIELSEDVRSELTAFAEQYMNTPIGQRVLVNDLGIWYRSVPIDRYAKFFEELPADCPCCLHRHVIDRMIKRYILAEEREDQMDIVEIGLEKFGPDTPVGEYLRRAYAFRMEDGFLVR
ncbi:MAG TPA: hypothetical protein ENN75_03380 [candidate division Zixibacteria bacterium]|nr:hypothetical protein [candidate division Zixibacteria bacterium]